MVAPKPMGQSMPVTRDDVLASLGKVAGPDGTPLPRSGALSEIVVGDGKVFFSINVGAAAVQAWESVRKRAEGRSGASRACSRRW
jgi:ATP-binding protein involved in chromosome partitioning